MKKTILIIVVILLQCSLLTAQENASEQFTPKIRGAIMMANSHVPSATEGGKEIMIIPLNQMYENKEEVYNAWMFGVAFNKRLWEKK